MIDRKILDDKKNDFFSKAKYKSFNQNSWIGFREISIVDTKALLVEKVQKNMNIYLRYSDSFKTIIHLNDFKDYINIILYPTSFKEIKDTIKNLNDNYIDCYITVPNSDFREFLRKNVGVLYANIYIHKKQIKEIL